jgi:hypothetical protein
MGVDYRAVAVVGICLNKSDLTVTERVKAFEHNYPDHWKVCPETGTKLWREINSSVFGEDFEYGYDKLSGDYLQTFHGSHYDDDPEVFIGRGVETSSNREGGGSAKLDVELDDLDKIAQALHELLDPLDIDIDIPSRLGIWAVLSVS